MRILLPLLANCQWYDGYATADVQRGGTMEWGAHWQ